MSFTEEHKKNLSIAQAGKTRKPCSPETKEKIRESCKRAFADKHRSFSRTHREGTDENPANREAGWKYALDTWRDYYDNVVRPQWGI